MLQAVAELRERPTRLMVLILCAVVTVVHQALRWDWYIDDAGICFAFARNLANGEGVVPWPGAERVEAVSDPLWILILAAFEVVGLDGFTVAKPLAMAMSVVTLFVCWRLARLALPEHRGEGALIAPMLLAMNAQFAIWSTSGLENGLFCMLLALAIWRTQIDVRNGGVPWSAVLYLLLAWTRPEAVLYAALGGLWFLVFTLREGRPIKWVGVWLAIFWIPSLILEACRLAYFAWPLPNTYYAKIEARGVTPLHWNARGWSQLRGWSARLWQGFYAPGYLLGITGIGGRPMWVGGALFGVLALSLLWPGPDKLQALWFWPDLPGPPTAFMMGRVVALSAAGLLLPLLALGRPGGRVLVLCGQTLAVGLLWGVYTNGDWMGAYRWMSLVTVPASVVLGAGIVHVIDHMELWASGQRRWRETGWITASVLVGLWMSPNLSQSRDHKVWNQNETTESVKRRVDHTRWVTQRTFYEGEVVNLDVDQGAHLFWAPDYVQVDMAMLVDVAMARHWYQQRAFIQEHVYDEMKPTFAHVGGWWAKHSGLRRYPGFHDTYFELPPYTDPRWNGPFRNVYGSRSLVMMEAGERPEGPHVHWTGGVTLRGVSTPTAWTPGVRGYLEVPISFDWARTAEEDVELIAFISDGERTVSWQLPLGYGMYPQAWFKPGEVFRGRHTVAVPKDLPLGWYDLGLVLIGPDGELLSAEEPHDGDIRFAAGEVLFQKRIEVVGAAVLEERIAETRGAAHRFARDGRCEDAERAWIVTKRHRPRNWEWHAETLPAVARSIADCWAVRAEGQQDGAVEHLARAHRWDHWSEELRRVGKPIAETLLAEGQEARTAEDWQTAYDKFSAVLQFQPWRSWARRWAEEARDHRLGLNDDVRIGIGGEDDLRAAEEAAAQD